MYKPILVFFIGIILIAAKPDTPAKAVVKTSVAVVQLDTVKPALRSFNRQVLEQYKKDKDFDYTDKNKENESWWDRFWRNFWNWLAELFGDRSAPEKPNTSLIKYILVAAAVGGLLFVIVK